MDPAPPQPPKPPQKQKGQPLVPQETHVLQQMLEDNARLLKLIIEVSFLAPSGRPPEAAGNLTPPPASYPHKHQAMGKFKECEQ